MRKVSNQWKRSTSVVMAALLACSGIQIPVQAKEAESRLLGSAQTVAADLESEVKAAEMNLSQEDKGQPSKEETVYVIADAGGSPEKLIVSDWLKNAMGSETLEDATELTNIINVKGTEGFQQKEGALGVWDAAGNDIYYQGNIQKELPVDLKVSYHLNGRAVSPQELLGQSGKVSIRFDYTNRQKEKVLVGEREEELYVPFIVLTGLVLNNENFRNIEVTNGKVINDGERTIVMGYAMPGLKDNLDIDSEDFDIEELDIPDYVEMTADVTDFELATTLTVATNEIFGDMDLDTQEKMDEMTADMDELQDAMVELMDGTSDLYDGVLELKDGTNELYDGMEELNDGARKLRDGASSLKSGAGELVKGVNQLADGLAELASKNEELINGATQVFESLLSAANTQLKQLQAALGITIPTLTMQNYAQVLNGLIQQIGAAGQPGTTGLNMAQADLSAELAGIMQEQDVQDDAGDGLAKDNQETKEETKQEETKQEEPKQEETKQEEPKQEEPEQGQPEKTEDLEQEKEPEKTELEEKENLEQEAQMTQAIVQEKEYVPVQSSGTPAAPSPASDPAAALAAAAASLKALKTQLDKYNQFYQGLQAYTAGVAQASKGAQDLLDGAKKLSSGAAELKDGTIELKDGTHELKDGGQELKDGVEELRDGSRQLKDGAVEFNDEGIQKLVDLFEGDIQELSDRMNAVKSAAKSYQSFAGIPEGMEGNVRFVYKTAGIEK